MSGQLYSSSWYRVAGLKPRLRSHIDIHRHYYRGQLWYVLQDRAAGRYQRFTPAAYHLIGRMDGNRTVQQIWDTARLNLGSSAPTQDEVIRLLSELHAVDALQTDILPDTAEIVGRMEKQRSARLMQILRSPLFMRFPLIDPDCFLTRFQFLVRPLFSWFGALLWLAVVGAAVFQAALHWPELTTDITDLILAPRNLLLLWLTFPVLKALHEFGHGFAVKVYGGEVHEMGLMLLVFTPIPYVDASSASAFRSKRKRALVGAAGILVELFCAALALLLWVKAEPGVLRAVAYNVIFIAGISSLLFNGNPLLRYDAYYILSDLIEIPNLASRGQNYASYLVLRYLFGAKTEQAPTATVGERIWFVVYTTLAWIYRIFVYLGIALFVAGRFFFIGVIFACWAAFTMFLMPIYKGGRFLVSSPRLRGKRALAMLVTGIFLGAVWAATTFLPVPLATCTEGVIWIPENGFVRAETNGFIEEVIKLSGDRVAAGDPLVICKDPLLPAEIQVLEAQRRELEVEHDTYLLNDRVQAAIISQEMDQIETRLQDALERSRKLTVRSGRDGILVIPQPEDLPGRFIRRGELLGYVMEPVETTARVVVAQRDIDLVRQKTVHVQVRSPENMTRSLPSRITRIIPAATDSIPDKALSQEGGGPIAADPTSPAGTKAFQHLFLVDVQLPSYLGFSKIGGRVYVRFDHGEEPVIWRWYRGIRRLFLREFNA